jgi:hypothetical protein
LAIISDSGVVEIELELLKINSSIAVGLELGLHRNQSR